MNYRDFGNFYIDTFIVMSAIKTSNLTTLNQHVSMEQLKYRGHCCSETEISIYH